MGAENPCAINNGRRYALRVQRERLEPVFRVVVAAPAWRVHPSSSSHAL
jgi:hypothetical protein